MPKSTLYTGVIWCWKWEDDELNPGQRKLVEDPKSLERIYEYFTYVHARAMISPLHDKDRWTSTDIKRYLDRCEQRYGIRIDRMAESWERPTGEYKYEMKGDARRRVYVTESVPIPQVGDLKKFHRHFVVKYDYSKPSETVIREFNESGFDFAYFEPVQSERAIIRYFCHLDNPEKARYKKSDVISLGGFDLQPLYDEMRQDKNKMMNELLEIIEQHPRIHDIKYLVQHCRANGRDDLVAQLMGHTYFWQKMLWSPSSKRSTGGDPTISNVVDIPDEVFES